MVESGVPAPVAMALLGIFVELAGSVQVLIGRRVWLGAGLLRVFAAIGAITAHAFWRISDSARTETIAVFLVQFS